jgi:hypothetical protein
LSIGGVTAAGAGGGTILLGENMLERVGPLADEMGANTFSEPWEGTIMDMLARNMSWLQARIQSGTRILDIGRDLIRDPSVFYAAETNMLESSGFERVFVKLVMVQGELQSLYEWTKVQ